MENSRPHVDHSPARQRFQNVLGSVASPYLLVFDDLTVVDANVAAESLLSHPASTLWGKELDALLHADDDRTISRSSALASGGPTAGWPAVLVTGEGKRIEVEITASTVERAGDPGRFYLVLEASLPAAAATRRALRAEASYDRLMALAHEGVWEVDGDGRTISANQRMADILGTSVAELEQASLLDFLDDAGRAEARAALSRRREGVAEQRDVVFTRPDGTTVHALVSATPEFDADGSFIGSLAVILDVTDRLQREALLRRADDQFTQSFDLAPIPKALVSTDGFFRRVNPAICDFLGLSTEELVGLHYLEVLAERPSAEQEAGWDAIIAGTSDTYSTELRCRHSAGYDAWARLTISGLANEDGSTDSLVVQLVDITEDKLQQINLREARDRFEALFQQAPTGIAQVTLDGRILAANPAFARLLGYEPSKLSGRMTAEITHPDDVDAGRRAFEALREGARDLSYERRLLRSDGSTVWVLLSATTIADATGRPAYAIAHVTDISTQKTIEAGLLHQALHDPLTALPNRALLQDRLAHALDRRRRSGTLALLFLDLDGFKDVNDKHGHAVGDALLVSTARRLTSVVRAGDTVARWGGDEFAILLEDIEAAGDAEEVRKRLDDALAEPHELGLVMATVTASIGIAVAADGSTPASIVQTADAAMYKAKAARKAS